MYRQVARQMLLAASIAITSANPALGSPSVYRCANAAGQVVFSDRPCAPVQRTPDPVARKPSPAEPVGGITAEQRRAFLEAATASTSRQIAAAAAAQARSAQLSQSPGRSAPESQTVAMRFGDCRASVRNTLLSVAGKTRTHLLVNTDALIIARVCTKPPESVLVTCSALDGSMTTTKSYGSGDC